MTMLLLWGTEKGRAAYGASYWTLYANSHITVYLSVCSDELKLKIAHNGKQTTELSMHGIISNEYAMMAH